MPINWIKMPVEGLSALIVDDDPNLSNIAKERLKGAGFVRVDMAVSVEEGYSFLRQRRYDLLLCATMIYGLETYMGSVVAKRARTMDQHQVIVGLSSDSGNQRFWKDLADYFFVKDELHSSNGLPRVLEERFGIKPA